MFVHTSDRVLLPTLRPTKTSINPRRCSFYTRRGKRIFDIFVSCLVLILAFPLLLLIALAVKISSSGPVLFRQPRVGLDGAEFNILKFRSMLSGAENHGPQITAAGDRRITAAGRVLRRTKLDELPQFWNVLRGDMSLVGPRPEVLKYVLMYTPEQRATLSIQPGITDPASIRFRHEESLISEQPDPERYYVECLMPQKLTMNLEYLANISFTNDIRVICRTVVATLQ